MPMPSEFATTPQPEPPQSAPQPGPAQSFKRAVKSLLLLLLTPLKPAARLVRRFLVGQIETQITNLHRGLIFFLMRYRLYKIELRI